MTLAIVTDLDGTLLDRDDYGFAPAVGAIERVKRLGVPLVLCSSKTRTEIDAIRGRIGTSDPFISENGGAIVAPVGYFPRLPAGAAVTDDRITLELGRPHADVVSVLARVAEAEGVTVVGFSDMTVSEVAADCGLSLPEAQLAKMREYDEPFRLVGADPDGRSRFLRALRRRGLKAVSGGRYDHASGDVDKGRAVSVLRGLLEEKLGHLVMVGLGDAMNDLSMLQAVDHPVIVRNPVGDATARLARGVPAATVTDVCGPEGWAQAVTGLLDLWKAGRLSAPAVSWRRRA